MTRMSILTLAGLSSVRKLFRARAAVGATLRCKLLGHQKAPYRFVGIQILAGLPDLLLDLVLFAAGPGIASTFHAERNHLRALVATIVGLNLRLHATLFTRRQLRLRRLFRATINLSPRFCRILHRDNLHLEIVLGTTSVRHHRIRRPVDHHYWHRTRR